MEPQLPYELDDKDSIIAFAKRLKGHTLRSICSELILQNEYKGKGRFGQLIEKFYFQYNPNSDAGPDFADAGLELKSSPLKVLKNGEFRSKERLVLNIINYIDLVSEVFETSAFWTKNQNLLLIFYLHETELDTLDYVIKLVEEWNFPDTDLAIIKKDWEAIQKKVDAGKAHELSEGDTFYLGACTKGANAKSTRKQPKNKKPAKQRAYALKQGYVNHIIATIAKQETGVYGKLLPPSIAVKGSTIEDVVISRFEKYYGQTVDQILASLPVKINMKAKDGFARLTKAILGVAPDEEIEEFEKAEVIVKTVRLEKDDLPKESLSFSSFKYEELIQEKWDESALKKILEHKFFFVFFKRESEQLILKKAKFWNMPFQDIEEAKKVWSETRRIVSKGNIVNHVKKGRRYTNFPKKRDNKVSHVRPHASNAADTFPLPKKDKQTGAQEYTKHCFWLNNTYLRDEIYLKQP